MTEAEKREAARQFYQKWAGNGKEDEEDRSYWLDILQRIMGADDATDRVEFQKKVIVDGNTKKIDAYIPETKVIIEQKTLGIPLDKKIHQSGGIDLTPYEQAKRYNDNLPSSEKARWIVTSNFAEIWVYDMDTRVPEDNITKIAIEDLQSHYSLLDFLLSQKIIKVTEEMELSLQAGTLVGRIHDRFEEQYHDPMAKKTQNSLNILCVRLVFCFYAEDAGLFGEKDAFTKYIAQYEPKDIRRALLDLFKVLDTPLEQREELYLDEELASFPYVNGGLFARENIEIPIITKEIKDTLIESSHFNWSKISPTIFGAVFESTLNPVTRRSGGMHYTSIENIHKVIDPLFLDDLKAELEEIKAIAVPKVRENRLAAFQDKLAALKFLDPACGSGNFLTETYVCIRRLENEVISELRHGQISMGFGDMSPIKVGIHQFFGIEINDFAVTVAKTALWIAESQMMQETEDVVHMNLDFLPLKTNACIVEANALIIDWNSIVKKDELSYIMGNPPFVGFYLQTPEQKTEVLNITGEGSLDYVSCWFIKSSEYIKNTNIKVAFVSTNSITQGEQVALLWGRLLNEICIKIDFAYRPFVWDSEANDKAHVHCVIIGFSNAIVKTSKVIFNDDGSSVFAENISPYLYDGESVLVKSRRKAISDIPELVLGNRALDGQNLLLTEDEYNALIEKEPGSIAWIRPFLGATEFINNKKRYCLWLVNMSPKELNSLPCIKERVANCRQARLTAKDKQMRNLADSPTLFREQKESTTDYVVLPRVSSSRRRYMPIGYIPSNVIAGDALQMLVGADLYHFGVLTSNVHNAWMRTVCGRMKSDYRYGKETVYNTFPWPSPSEDQKAKIEQTAQGILDARANYPNDSLADLYDPLTMPSELRKAHQANDRAVMQAYGLDIKTTSEEDCVAFLMKLYQALTSKSSKNQ